MTSAAAGVQPGPLITAWQSALSAQHAAIYGYGLSGVHLQDAGQIQSARTLQQAHRDTRDMLMKLIAAAGALPATPDPTYLPPKPVTDPATAQAWSLQLEQACAASYRYVLSVSADPAVAGRSDLATVRKLALTGLLVSAEAATQWQSLLTPNNPTVAFPGT